MRVELYCVWATEHSGLHSNSRTQRQIKCHKLNCVSVNITTVDNQDYYNENDDDKTQEVLNMCIVHHPHCKREHQSIRCSFELHFQLLDIWLNSIRFSKHFIRILTSHFRSISLSLACPLSSQQSKKTPFEREEKQSQILPIR